MNGRGLAAVGVIVAVASGMRGAVCAAEEVEPGKAVEVQPGEFRGIWYPCGTVNTLPGKKYVYSGAKATYCTWLRPMAVYAEAVDKTFFVFGEEKNRPAVSSYDHKTGSFARPVIVGDNPDMNAHRNPTLLIDEGGFLFVFWGYNGGVMRVVRSARPYDLSEWTAGAMVDVKKNASYPQPWQLKAGQILVSFRQEPGWRFRISRDGAGSWAEPVTLVAFAESRIYGISVAETGGYPRRVHFAWSKLGGGSPEEIRTKHLWARRYDVYYACSDDGGKTWRKADGTRYDLPITEEAAEKVYECGEHGVWLKDMQLDAKGNPYILFSDSDVATYESVWKVAWCAGGRWALSDVARSDHIYDDGALVMAGDEDIRVYAPTTAVQAHEDGGEIEEWRSGDGGKTWKNSAHITSGSRYSHNHVKSVFNRRAGREDFTAFWSYGDATDSPATRDVELYYHDGKKAAARRIAR